MRLQTRFFLRLLLILGAVALATALRLRGVELLPADYDEDNYLRAGQQYAAAMRSGDWELVLTQDELSEHPPVAKLIYGAVLLTLPPTPLIPERGLSEPPDEDLPEPHATRARLAATAFGIGSVALLAVVDPLAATLLAIGTWPIKYSSQIYIEAQAAFFALAAVLCYTRSRGISRGWLLASAVLVGLTAATKYVYGVVAVAIVLDWLLSGRWPGRFVGRIGSDPSGWRARGRFLPHLALWAAVALGVFFLADPQLWSDPIERMRNSLAFHQQYATGASVAQAGYPVGQPLIWLTQSVPWHPGVFLIEPDAVVTILAALGLPIAFVLRRVFALWLLAGLVFLVLWPTKWPQYTLVLYTPLALVAAEGARWLASLAWRAIAQLRRYRPA